MTFHIVVPGVAATGEPRVNPRTKGLYTTAVVRRWKKHVAEVARQHHRQAPMLCPVFIEITIRRVRPKSWPDKPTKACPWPWAPYKKPDLDNGCYQVSNALSGVVYKDDAQIIGSCHWTEWADRDEVVITVTEAQEHYHGEVTGSGAPVSAESFRAAPIDITGGKDTADYVADNWEDTP